MSDTFEPSEMSKSMKCWGIVLEATHKIAEATKQIEATKEYLQALHELCRGMSELDMSAFQQALAKLQECETKIDQLSRTGVPLKEQHQRVEECLKQMIQSGIITTNQISEIKAQLDASIHVSEQYLEEMTKFMADMEKLRDLFAGTIAEVVKDSERLEDKATSEKRWGYGRVAVLAGVVAVLGITCSPLVAAPLSVAAGFAAVKTAHKTQLGAHELTERAQLFRQAAAALQACDRAFEALEQKVSSGPISLTHELVDSLRHVLQVYSMVHKKDEEIERLRSENIQLAAAQELSIVKEEEIQSLKRQLSRLQSGEEAPPDK